MDFEKVKVHIEKLYNRELSSIQCETLKAIIRGDNFPIIKRDTNIFKDFGCEVGEHRLNLV